MDPRMSDDLIQAAREIELALPEVRVDRIEFLGAGMDSDAFLVNDGWVFRFPKRAEVGEALRREIAVLPLLAARVPVAVPRFEYVGAQSNGLPFVGYRAIQGEPLEAELFEGLSAVDRERALTTLAGFLQGVHRFPVGQADAMGVGRLSTRAWVSEAWDGAAQALPLLNAATAASLRRMVEAFLTDEGNFEGAPTLLYADFAPEHILFDLETGRITGIIDWGDLAIGDPDFDLLYLRQDYGEPFVRELLRHYPHAEPERLLRKLRVFDACDHLNSIVGAVAEGDEAAVREWMEALGELAAAD